MCPFFSFSHLTPGNTQGSLLSITSVLRIILGIRIDPGWPHARQIPYHCTIALVPIIKCLIYLIWEKRNLDIDVYVCYPLPQFLPWFKSSSFIFWLFAPIFSHVDSYILPLKFCQHPDILSTKGSISSFGSGVQAGDTCKVQKAHFPLTRITEQKPGGE